MQTRDEGLLFQTDQQLAAAKQRAFKLAAATDVGSPIAVNGKVLDLLIAGDDAFVAESGWQARCMDLRTGKTRRLYKGHRGPVTSLAMLTITEPDSPSWRALFTGSWDKSIRVWDADTAELLFVLEGHSDFVKSLTVIPHCCLLVSTSTDRSIRLWDLTALKSKLAPITTQVVRAHHRPVDCVVWRADGLTITLWSADSMGVIKQWSLRDGSLHYAEDLKGHETSVAQLAVDEEGLWSVSMDKTAVFHPFDGSPKTVVEHDSYVKSVMMLNDGRGRTFLLTGSDDEDIRVWDVSTRSDGRVPLEAVVPGHCGEISALRPWTGSTGVVVVSSSLDGTLRRWTLQDLLVPQRLAISSHKETTTLTVDEERELAELLSDDDS
ncbi:cytoplasm protein [Naematelia encephala]|uniref:Cytoplasm protein n=1 Tax=Naematelia encephala TaxID=71784 RepID=A0A1Y2BI47_9TREE|nr:cytoplasm protein [Naematelia encephala]